MKYPRLIIAATKSNSGKTTITCGLIRAMQNKGLNVASYKSGPDYIDPSYLNRSSKSVSRNLDSYLMPKNNLLVLFAHSFGQNDIALIEGAMGLFDGQGSTGKGSSAHLSKTLKCPVVLIIDASHTGSSIAATAYGFNNLDPEVDICGVILNNVASARHLNILKLALKKAKVPLIGYLFKNKNIAFKKRHLGLLMANEVNQIDEIIDEIAGSIQKNFNLNKLISIASKAQDLEIDFKINKAPGSVRIGVAKDEAFNFYYQDNLDLLQRSGAKLYFFSPLKDTELPRVDGLYFGGGYPEIYAGNLSKNKKLKKEINEAINSKMPVYAECGGFLYLSKKLITSDGSFKMVGALDTTAAMQKSFTALGYSKASTIEANILTGKNKKIKGHRFHYSTTSYPKNNTFAYALEDGEKLGCIYKNTLASYLHLHFGSDFKLAKNFVTSCKEYS
jgi:cobyrinic acid a,c-diamide synthase